jgi:DNA-binding CsgD family transcriptional regulator
MTTDNLTKIPSACEVITSQTEAIRRISDLIARHNEVLIGYAYPQIAEFYCSYFKRIWLPALRRGASVRTIYTDAVYSDTDGISFIRDTVRAGCQARTVTHLPTANYPASVIIGRQVALLWPAAGSSDCRWSIHHDGNKVTAINGHLENLWNTAAPVDPANAAACRLTPLERRILHQLCLGAKDVSAARMLGISVRTYRRHVTAVCVRLDASTRFEAGVKAAMAGLIGPGY